jgi:hypothetical protein
MLIVSACGREEDEGGGWNAAGMELREGEKEG